MKIRLDSPKGSYAEKLLHFALFLFLALFAWLTLDRLVFLLDQPPPEVPTKERERRREILESFGYVVSRGNSSDSSC